MYHGKLFVLLDTYFIIFKGHILILCLVALVMAIWDVFMLAVKDGAKINILTCLPWCTCWGL